MQGKSGYYLVLNSGSSSIKFAGYAQEGLRELFSGQIDAKGQGKGQRKAAEFAVTCDGQTETQTLAAGESLSFAPIFTWLTQRMASSPLLGIGHRVVHGGEAFHNAVMIDDRVITAIQDCSRFAPLHNPSNLQGIDVCRQHYPDIPQIAVFDTAFHQSLAAKAYLYPLPYGWYQDHGVRRYGFHGTSHEYVVQQAAQLLGFSHSGSANNRNDNRNDSPNNSPNNSGSFISLHLGNGCSAAAVENGVSRDTTMGLTPLEGMMMGTRSGDIDPGLAQYLCHALDISIDEVTNQLNKASGLLGISQLTSDMRDIQAAADQGNEQAGLALTMFCYRAAKAVAAMRVALSSLDGIIFTGGIGEHSVGVRQRIIEQLAWLGAALDPQANEEHGKESGGIISPPDQQPRVMVIPTDEERMIAKHVQRLVALSGEQ